MNQPQKKTLFSRWPLTPKEAREQGPNPIEFKRSRAECFLGMNEKLINMGAMLLVGDGLLTAFRPRKETFLWKNGPKPYRAVMEAAAARPDLARIFGLLEFGVGIWLASRQWQRQESVT